MIAFSEAYERSKESLIADTPLELEVRVDQRGEQIQLLIENAKICAVVTESAAPRPVRRLHLRLPLAAADDDRAMQVHDALHDYPGEDGAVTVLKPVRLRVDAAPNLLADLRGLLGPAAARAITVIPTPLAPPAQSAPARDYEAVSAD